MSVPDLTGDVKRATRVTIRGQLPVTGETVEIVTDAFEARALQHELDHCQGLLFLDRVAGAHALHARQVYLEAPGEDGGAAGAGLTRSDRSGRDATLGSPGPGPRSPTGRGRRLKPARVWVRVPPGARRRQCGAARRAPNVAAVPRSPSTAAVTTTAIGSSRAQASPA